MGIFDVFKSKNPIEDVLTTLHCTNANEWSDAGKNLTPLFMVLRKTNFLNLVILIFLYF